MQAKKKKNIRILRFYIKNIKKNHIQENHNRKNYYNCKIIDVSEYTESFTFKNANLC